MRSIPPWPLFWPNILKRTPKKFAGVARVAERWTDADGDEQAMATFCKDHWVPAEDRHRLRDRLETALEQIHGHLYEARRVLRKWTDTRGDDLPQSDDLLAQFDPAADLSEQLWKQKLGFLCRLHFDDPDLATMLAEGGTWSSDQWADARLSQAFGARIPAELSERSRHIGHAASKWVSEQHIPVGGVVTADGQAPFEPDRKLLWHWLVREELRGRYGDGADGLPVQRALASVMGRAIEGRIPASVGKEMPRRSGIPRPTRSMAWPTKARTSRGTSTGCAVPRSAGTGSVLPQASHGVGTPL